MRIETKTDNRYSKFIIFALFACSVSYGFLPQVPLSVTVLALVALSFFSDEIYYLFPFMIFYYSIYGTVFGVSVFRFYSLLMTLKLLIKRNLITLPIRMLLPLAIYLLYTITVFFFFNPKMAIFNLFSILTVLIVTREIFPDCDKTKRFFSIYSIVAIASFITGIVYGNTLNYAEIMVTGYVEMRRFMATFEDPNYMGFFMMIAIFAPIILKLYSKTFRIIVVVLLSVSLFMSVSMSAILGYSLIWIAYFILVEKKRIRFWLGLTGIALILLILYNSGVLNSIPFINVLLRRIETKISFAQSGDLVGATSNRVNRFREHISYFLNEPFIKQLFGGNFVTTFGTNVNGLGGAMAHNEYIDLLLNVGIIGEAVFLIYLGWSIYIYMKSYLLYQNELDFFKVILKCIWAYYAFTITIFMDFRFMFPFLI